MKQLRLIPSRKLSNEMESNRLLRSFWAELKSEFGGLNWQYNPTRDGKKGIVNLGFVQIDQSTIKVDISYKVRGVIHELIFEGSDLPDEQLKVCLRRAENAALNTYYLQRDIVLFPSVVFQSETTDFFSLRTVGEGKIRLTLKIQGYDGDDSRSEFQGLCNVILNILSAFTNLSLDYTPSKKSQEKPLHSRRANASLAEDWIDNHPIIDGLVVLSSYCIALIDKVIDYNLNEDEKLIIDSCNHFHSGRHFDKNIHFNRHIDRISSELSVVLYVSALEVLATIGGPKAEKCEKCSQDIFRLSKRVEELVKNYLGPGGAKMVKDLYSTRSKYLHTGRMLSSNTWQGTTIPQLDSSSDHGVKSPMPMVPLLNLREITSFCIRSVTQTLLGQ